MIRGCRVKRWGRSSSELISENCKQVGSHLILRWAGRWDEMRSHLRWDLISYTGGQASHTQGISSQGISSSASKTSPSQSNCTSSSPTSSLSQFSSSSSLSSKNHHHHHPHRQHHHRQQHHQSDPHCQHHNSHHHHHQVTREFTQCSRTWVFKSIHCLISS